MLLTLDCVEQMANVCAGQVFQQRYAFDATALVYGVSPL
jgi:hypothetical protein